MRLRKRHSLHAGLSVAALAACLVPAVSQAQEADAEGARAGGIAEITVTAQRYEQSLQDTPVSIVAVSGDQLASQGTDSLGNFDTFIPNVSVGGSAAQGNAIATFAIRGIGGAASGFVTQESSVGIYVDDILFARPNGALLDLLDVERVEVLRGPQGTLFGRNTAGGAIRYVSKQPVDKLEGSLKALAGSRDRYEITGMLNVPLADSLAARFSFAKKSRDGYIHRVIDDTWVGGGESTTLRAQLRWQPTSRLTVSLTGDLIRTSDNGTPTIATDFSPTDLYPAALYGVSIPGDPPPSPAAYNSLRATAPAWVSPSGYTDAAADFAYYESQVSGPYEVYGGLKADTNRFRSYGLSAIVAYDLTDTIEVKSLTGYRDLSQVQFQDFDRTPIPLYQLDETIDVEYFTQELQFSGSSFDDRLKWVAGLFYYWDQANDIRRRFDPSAGANSAAMGDTGKGNYESKFIKTESYAAFAQGTFTIVDGLSATAGIRWSKDTKEFSSFREARGQECISGGAVVPAVGNPANCPPGSVSTPVTQTVEGSWSNFSPRLGLEYRWSPEVMTYISAAKGYKGGGFNDSLQTRCYRSPLPDCGLAEFQAENLWTYEAGLRTDLFDRRVRFNVTGFLTKYKDQQIQLIDVGPPPLQYTINGDSTVKGVEVDFIAAPVDGLTLRASAGYVDAHYDEELDGLSGALALAPSVPFFRSPKWSYALGATYEFDLANTGTMAFDVNWGWKDKQASYPNPTNMVMLPSYGLLNGRISFKADSGWSIAVFGNNLTDKYYLTGGFDPGGPVTDPTPGVTGVPHDRVFGFAMLDIGRPREIGVEIGFAF